MRTILFFCLLLILAIYFGNDILILFENSAPSHSYGVIDNGHLLNGKRLPNRGPNFRAYSYTCTLLGRNAVHENLRGLILDVYQQMQNQEPDKLFVYGETGWSWGGPFPPHTTHQNGLSVDFMVPVLDAKGRSVFLPTGLWNHHGYGFTFDEKGRYTEYKIDFEAMAKHLLLLQEQSHHYGVSMKRVIFDGALLQSLFQTAFAESLKENIPFSDNPGKWRHDEHYHIDFDLIKPQPDPSSIKRFRGPPDILERNVWDPLQQLIMKVCLWN